MQLVIAEKPSVARDIARVLGVPARGGSTSFAGRDFAITWCIGHLVELVEPAAYNGEWKAWRLDRLPMLPDEFQVQPASHARAQLKAVSALLKDRSFTAVINACDAGREGELIFRYVYEYARSRLPIRRLWISSLTDDAIRKGMASLRPGAAMNDLADAARSRSEADWLVGMNATRAVTVRGRAAGTDALASIGRVQTPTLAMLVAREREIRDFVPHDYWEVRAQLVAAAGDRPFASTWKRGTQSRIGTAALAQAIVERDTQRAEAIVERVKASVQKEPAPQLFDLTSLQRTANRRFGFSAQRTLEIAQALYEKHKLLTYPRTDSRHLSSDVAAELQGPLDALAQSSVYTPFVARIAPGTRLSRRFVDDSKVRDHHAIIPTATPAYVDSLDRDAARIYDLVARRFLGAFFPDAEFAATEVWIAVGTAAEIAAHPLVTARPRKDANAAGSEGDDEGFITALPPMPDRYVTRGRVRLVAGWQDVAGIDARTATSSFGPPDPNRAERDEPEANELPALAEGQRLRGTFASVAKKTKPPPRYTEATLLAGMETAGKRITDEALREAMKDTGLGTPATRASIIETLLRREYIARDRKDLVATPLGMQLIETLPVASLASPELTGAWEARLAAIARGADSRAAFMADIARYVRELVDIVRGSVPPGTPPSGRAPGSAPPAYNRAPAKGRGGKSARGRSAFASRGSSSAARSGAPSRASRSSRVTVGASSTSPRSSDVAAASSSASRSAPRAGKAGGSRSRASRALSDAAEAPVPRPPPPRVPPPPRAKASGSADISVASTEWLVDAILSMAPKPPSS